MMETNSEPSRESWLYLISGYIQGDCLNIGPLSAERQHILSELTEELEVLPDDNPQNASKSNKIYNTIIDIRYPRRGKNIEKHLHELSSLLHPSGILIFALRDIRNISSLIWEMFQKGKFIVKNTQTELRSSTATYTSFAKSAGFNDGLYFATIPNLLNPKYTFFIGEEAPISSILSSNNNELSSLHRAGILGMKFAGKANLLQHIFPTIIAIYSKDHSLLKKFNPDIPDSREQLVIRGVNRSIILSFRQDEVCEAKKVPQSPNDDILNRRANNLLKELREHHNSISHTLPECNLIQTRLGNVLIESPVNGSPITDRYDKKFQAFSKLLCLGLDWVSKLQSYRQTKSTDEFWLDMSKGRHFSPVPVHGDLHPGNIYISDGSISEIIDWEYGTLRGNPLIDPIFYLLKLSEFFFGDFQKGAKKVLLEKNCYQKIASKYMREYCQNSPFDIDDIITNLKIPLKYQVKLNQNLRNKRYYSRAIDDKHGDINYLEEIKTKVKL